MTSNLGILRARVANLHLWENHFEPESPPKNAGVTSSMACIVSVQSPERRSARSPRGADSKRRRQTAKSTQRGRSYSISISTRGAKLRTNHFRSRAISKSATAAPDAGFCPVMTRLLQPQGGGPRLVGPLVISAASHHGFCFSSRGLAARQLESPNPLRQAARGRIEGGLPAEESASLTLGWKPGNFWQQTYQLNSIAALRCAAAISSSSARLSTWASWSRSRALPGIPRV